MGNMRSPIVFAVTAMVAAFFLMLNSSGHVTITMGVARLIIPTQLELLAAFVFGLVTMTPFVLPGGAGGNKLIGRDKEKPKLVQAEREKQLEAEVAKLKSELTKKKK
jgi:hypothetical protein